MTPKHPTANEMTKIFDLLRAMKRSDAVDYYLKVSSLRVPADG